MDVVGEQPRMPGQHAGERLVDGPEQRVDRAVALGRRPPVVVARGDDDRAAAARVAARRRRPAGELQGVGLAVRSSGHLRGVAVAPRVAGVVGTPSRPGAVVKWRSSRRRSSEPDFQIAYSSESASADAEAAMMFVSLPIVDHVRAPSIESMMTRVRAAVAAPPSRMRTL